MQETLTISALDTEVLSSIVTGFANYAPTIDFRGMVSGDTLTVKLYRDVVGTDDRLCVVNVELTWDDLQDMGQEGDVLLPFTLEDSQTATVGFTLTAGTVPLGVPIQIANPQTGE